MMGNMEGISLTTSSYSASALIRWVHKWWRPITISRSEKSVDAKDAVLWSFVIPYVECLMRSKYRFVCQIKLTGIAVRKVTFALHATKLSNRTAFITATDVRNENSRLSAKGRVRLNSARK